MSALYQKSLSLVVDVIFKDVVEYLFLLQQISLALCQSSRGYSTAPLIFFAAAAVSDYYIPKEKMSREKISGGDGLTLHFENVPKVLGLLQEKWMHRDATLPKPFTVTFKLETTEETMHEKAKKNLNAYSCDAVVANMLQTYKEKVWVYLLEEKGKEPFIITKGDRTIESALRDHFLAKIAS
uniref:Phosphopantothenate---cysteine ligase n=1 Tax=Angomonas desouzai TaxID=59800 RepID=T1YT64_9TRYP|nr:phosphopantothenate---cysteine ligase [Angomonas desouzai]